MVPPWFIWPESASRPRSSSRVGSTSSSNFDRARDVDDLVLLRDLTTATATGKPSPTEIRAASAAVFEARADEAQQLGHPTRSLRIQALHREVEDKLVEREAARLDVVHELSDSGLSQRAIADALGVSHQRVNQLVNG